MAYKLQLRRGLLSALPTGIAGEPLFATDTNDLYISNGTTNQKFQKFIASGTSSQFLKGDGTIDSTVYVPTTRTLTINGTAYDLSADRSWTIAAGITGSGVAGQISYWDGTSSQAGSAGLIYTDSTGLITLSKNQNNPTRLLIQNINSGNNATPIITFQNNQGADSASIYKGSTGQATFKNITPGSLAFYNANYGTTDISFLNDCTGGKITFTAGSFSGTQMTLTAAGRLLLGTTTESTYLLDINGTGRFNTDLYVHNSTGEARIEIGRSTTGARSVLFSNFTAGLIYYSGSGGFSNYVYYYDGSSTIFQTNGSNRLTIASDGAATFSSDLTVNGVLKETVTTNRQTASYTLALTDRGKLVEMNVATANNLTVPLNSSIAFPIGSKIDLSQYGAGQTTIVATGGVTVRSAGGALKLALQYSGASLVKIATDEWYLFGDITV